MAKPITSLIAFFTELNCLAEARGCSEIEMLGKVLWAYDTCQKIGGNMAQRELLFDTVEILHHEGQSFAEHYLTLQNRVPASDEPSFTVLGRDQLAQATVVHWIERARVADVPEAKIERALQRYQEIVEFQSDNPDRVKRPD